MVEPPTETDLRTIDAAFAAASDLAHQLRLARDYRTCGSLKPALGALARLSRLAGPLDEIAERCVGAHPLNGEFNHQGTRGTR